MNDPRKLKDRMSLSTATASINLFTRLLDSSRASEARVTYYGGEPLLNQEVIKETLPRIRNIQARGLQRPVEAVMITNGTLYSEEIADLFRQYGSAVCVSIDGLAEQHDAARVTTRAGLRTRRPGKLKRYQDKGLRIGLSCTIGKHNVTALSDVARFFVRELGIREIEFQMPYQVPDQGNAFYVSMSEATDHMLRACDVMMDELGVHEFTTFRRLESFVTGHWRHRDWAPRAGRS